ncbi:hypothetical protein [Acetonema longum]|uniref:Uncharacterized protein n=1 Tax=Acetonema longum DSM 6540 TaxID=1009370 RepID=F7NEJ6_9FIRM|nr:hypothetical protein [Acetonema longum]EGO65407.1 hypothetical protein ALO_02296 [Acetonema longum DSM 6540]
MAELEKLTAEQKELAASITNSPAATVAPKSLFRGLSETTGQPESLFKVLVFGTLVLVLYLGQILTAWRVDVVDTIKNETIAARRETSETPDAVLDVSEEERQSEEEPTICPQCGKPFPAVKGKKYCSPNCRLQAFRGKRILKVT